MSIVNKENNTQNNLSSNNNKNIHSNKSSSKLIEEKFPVLAEDEDDEIDKD